MTRLLLSWRHGLLASGLMLAVACTESTGPGDVFNPEITSQSTANVTDAMANNQAIRSLEVLGGDLSASPSAPAPVGVQDPALRTLGSAVFNSAAMAPIFPVDKLGKTLVCAYDELEHKCHFEVDEARTGAPADGVRFILYSVDPILKKVVFPLQEIGYLDVVDQSTAAAAVVGITAVVSGNTVLDYDASAVVATTGVTFNAEGYLTDGSTRVNFDLTQNIAQNAAGIDYSVSVAGEDKSVHLVANGTREDPMATINLTVVDRGHTVLIEVTATPEAVTGTVSYDGTVVINITGTKENPVFTHPDGSPVLESDLVSLRRLFHFVGELFDRFDNLLRPAHRTLSINW